MKLNQYVEALRQHLHIAAQAGGDEAAALADRLTAPLEAATRLVLLEALAAAVSEITCELAPASVDLRLRGSDPEFVVTPAPELPAPEAGNVSAGAPADSSDSDEAGTSRVTLRLPESLKLRAERAADRDGLSVNAWLVRALATALEAKGAASHDRPAGAERHTGWVR